MVADGIHDLTRAEYDVVERVNFSRLKALAKSPAHFRYEWDHPEESESSDARRLGNATHHAIFEPMRFAKYATWTGKVRNGGKWDEFKAKHGEEFILLPEQYERALAIGKAVRSHPKAAEYLAEGKPEASVLWTHQQDGKSFEMKGRLDWIGDGDAPIVDLKTCRDASIDAFGKAAWNFKYHVQAALYRDAVEAVTGVRKRYVLLAVESEPPFIVQPYVVPEHLLEQGRREYRDWLGMLAICREAKLWPAYGVDEMELTLPRWAKDYAEEMAP